MSRLVFALAGIKSTRTMTNKVVNTVFFIFFKLMFQLKYPPYVQDNLCCLKNITITIFFYVVININIIQMYDFNLLKCPPFHILNQHNLA